MCTSIPGSQVPKVDVPHVDKVVHFLLYAVLGLLLARALGRARPAGRSIAGALVAALATIAVFAAVDEWHQAFVPGRSTELLDWCADLAGATFALTLAGFALPRPEHST